jgi:uncharacterized damage-inducible protein DinB
MKRMIAVALGMILAMMTTTTLGAQSTAGGGVAPHVAILKAQADTIRSFVLRTAEKVPENLYDFKPTPDVRSVASLLGHIADGNNLLCGLAGTGKTVIDQSNEKKTTRADLVAALKASYAACDQVFAATTDANATTPVDFFGQKQTRLGMLAFTNSHMWEHYGNLVTYMRLKNIVPPSSER